MNEIKNVTLLSDNNAMELLIYLIYSADTDVVNGKKTD